MNGLRNMIFIILLFFIMVALAYVFSIGDIIVFTTNQTVDQFHSNPGSLAAAEGYVRARNLFFSMVTLFFIPFLVTLAYASSFINNQQSILSYFIQTLAVLLATPLAIYLFSAILTNMFSVNFLDPAYIVQDYFSNFALILIVNMFLSIASFIFVRQTAVTS